MFTWAQRQTQCDDCANTMVRQKEGPHVQTDQVYGLGRCHVSLLDFQVISQLYNLSKFQRATSNGDITWAWQNPHVTLHIPSESRLQHATAKKRSGQPKRPRHTVTSLLSNLHLLLRVPSFARWPLEVRFFSEDVHKSWVKWTSTVAEPVRPSLDITTDFSPKTIKPISDDSSSESKRQKTTHGIEALDIDYKTNKLHVEKGGNITDFEREGSCAICLADLEHSSGIYTICSHTDCEAVTHLTCLSKHFLKDEEESLVPIKGICPSCKTETKWIDIVKELTLRMRGQKEVEKLLKTKRVRKDKTIASQALAESSEDEDLDEEKDIEDELERREFIPAPEKGDDWYTIDDSESDTGSVTSNASQSRPQPTQAAKKPRKQLPIVIEDSDWDDAEVLD